MYTDAVYKRQLTYSVDWVQRRKKKEINEKIANVRGETKCTLNEITKKNDAIKILNLAQTAHKRNSKNARNILHVVDGICTHLHIQVTYQQTTFV